MTQPKQATVAGALIFDKHDRIFLAKFATKFDGDWSIPGGKIDYGEVPLEAVIREAKEETNIDIENVEFFAPGAFLLKGVHIIYFDYIAECPEVFDVKINAEFSEWGFFGLADLAKIHLPQHTLETVLRAMRARSRDKIVRALSRYNLGLIRKTVSLQEHQTDWAEAYELVAGKLRSALTPDSAVNTYTLDHFGSTSILGLHAKPVIDMLLQFTDLATFQKDIAAIEQLGFIYKGDAIANVGQAPDSARHFFSFYDKSEQIDYVHLHALPNDHPHVGSQLKFRDILRKAPVLAQEYEVLKKKLRASGLPRREYTMQKSEFIAKILSQK